MRELWGKPNKVRRAYILSLAALTGVYFLAGKIGLSLAFVNESTSAVWPPTGIAVASLLILGLRAWPAIAIGAFLVNLTTSGDIVPSVIIAAGNTLEGVAAAWLTSRVARGTAAFEHVPDIFKFTLLAGALAPIIAASVGVSTLVASGLAQPADAGSIWLTWWLGDMVGTIVIAPLILLWRRPSTVVWTEERRIEAVALFLVLMGVSFSVFGALVPGGTTYPLEFLNIPVLLWAAFRLGARETAAAVAVVSVVAIAGTLRGFGPFARPSPNESLLLLQSYLGVTTVVLLTVAAEVSARRRAQAEMRALNDTLERRVAARTEELLRTHSRLLDAQQVAHVGSWEWDVLSNALWWSDELYRIYGVERDSATTYEAFLARVHSDDRELIDRTVRQAMADGRPFAFEHRIVRPDGTVRVLHAEGRVLTGTRGEPVQMMGTGHDITELKRAEEERAELAREQHARTQAEDANRRKDGFLATLSHELRTPLNAALGWAHMLRELPRDDARTPRATEAIYRNLLMQARLVSDIMDVSRIAIGGLRLEAAAASAPAIVEAALETVSDTAAARRVTIDTKIAAQSLDLQGDARRLQQVVWNLLSNALKFTPEGGHVEVAVARRGDSIEIVVSDDGPGIDPEFLPYVFEQFRQADESTTREHGGLGLGLAIAHHIVELHGGTIEAANGASGGAIFTVRLPAAAAAAAV